MCHVRRMSYVASIPVSSGRPPCCRRAQFKGISSSEFSL
jgi:hypothetical protein